MYFEDLFIGRILKFLTVSPLMSLIKNVVEFFAIFFENSISQTNSRSFFFVAINSILSPIIFHIPNVILELPSQPLSHTKVESLFNIIVEEHKPLPSVNFLVVTLLHV